MRRERIYYLGRVRKLGSLDDAGILQAVQRTATVEANGFAWSFTDVVVGGAPSHPSYVFGFLSKYRPEGIVRAVDQSRGVRREHSEPNLLVESSPFVYLPAFSAIAYQHVWNKIERTVFVRRFCELVERAFGNFFVSCEIEPIVDLRTFAVRLQRLDKITELSASVHPPNPLFGRAWKELRDYLRRRAAAELAVREKGTDDVPIKTELVRYVLGMLEQADGTPYSTEQPIDLSDAALLMALDGYGRGAVRGTEDGAAVTIRTGEKQKSFRFEASPSAGELYQQAKEILERINRERDLGHT